MSVKILLSYGSEYDKGEGIHFLRVLRRMGHEVVPVNAASQNGRGAPGQLVQGFPAWVNLEDLLGAVGGADLFLYVEPFGLVPRGLEVCPIPTACVICDFHRSFKPRQILASMFDHVFLYQRNYVERLHGHPPGAVHWFPFACDTEVLRDLGLPRDLDVAHVGQLGGHGSGRRRAIEALNRRYKMNEQKYYLQEEIPGVYSRAKIVVNIPAADDLNFRFFEALSCGALLLTKRVNNGQEELFEEGVHFAAFGNDKELFEKVDHYLRNDEERREIASAGRAEVLQRHTLEHRLKLLLEKVQAGPAFSAPVRKMGRDEVLKTYGAVYARYGKVEALLRMAAEEQRYSRRWLLLVVAASRSFLRRVVLDW